MAQRNPLLRRWRYVFQPLRYRAINNRKRQLPTCNTRAAANRQRLCGRRKLREFQKNSCPRANFGSLMHKAKEGTFLEFLKAFPGLFATLWHLQHIFVCDFWDNLRTGKASTTPPFVR
jgi:hypothetical protein